MDQREFKVKKGKPFPWSKALFFLSFGSSVRPRGCLEVRASIFSSLPTTHYSLGVPLCLSITRDYRKEFLSMKNDSVLTLLLSSRLSQEQQCG